MKQRKAINISIASKCSIKHDLQHNEWQPWAEDLRFTQQSDVSAEIKPGELRWHTTLEGKTQWLENGEAFQHRGERIKPRSRTFIPAKLHDNPILAATGYEATLQAMPEPSRSILLYGIFAR
jgi:hypothetical protein